MESIHIVKTIISFAKHGHLETWEGLAFPHKSLDLILNLGEITFEVDMVGPPVKVVTADIRAGGSWLNHLINYKLL